MNGFLKRNVIRLVSITCKAIGILLLGGCIKVSSCSAQTGIGGIIVGLNGKPIVHANVLLLHTGDSTLVKGTFSKGDGSFSFEQISNGTYIVTASFTGYQQVYTFS